MSSGTAAQERDKELSLVQHLGELRDRLMVTAIALVATTAIAFYFGTQLIRILIIPIDCTFIPAFTCHEPPTTLISLSPTENFATYFRVALFAGFALAMPVILYEIYAYVDPALLPKERRFIRFMGLPVIGLFIAGMLFCYFVLLPNAIKFLINFGDEVIKNQLRAADYISFVTIFILGMGLIFEVPVAIFALVKIHVITRQSLAKQRRYAVLVAFLIAAVITPTPDPFNQTLVAIPMYLLFELGLFVARFA
jgi:Twin arginine targeting (Tat) protein translocase TatC